MSYNWNTENSRFRTGNGHEGSQHILNENHFQPFNRKTYINPQKINYELIKQTFSRNCFPRSNKIHVNPNFRGGNISSNSEESCSYLSNLHSNFQSSFPTGPGASNTTEKSLNKNKINATLEKNVPSSSSTVHNSRFKKVNVKIKSKYWSKNPSSRENLNQNFSNNQKCTSLTNLVSPNLKQSGQSVFKSKTKIIRTKNKVSNISTTKLISPNTVKSKLPSKDCVIKAPSKQHFYSSKYVYDKSKSSPLLKVAKAVQSKYKYLKNSDFKKSKYKIDKRKILPQPVRKKNSTYVKDIRKLFPNPLNSKLKSPYYVYNLGSGQTISKNKTWRKNDSSNKVIKNLNKFPNRQVVKIGGILYKSTTNKLTLAHKKRQSRSKKNSSKANGKFNHVVYVRGERFILEKNGKALRRQCSKDCRDKSPLLTPKRIDIGGVTYLRKSCNVLIRTNVHQARQLVNKAKNKSIALLINLRKRSSMPCMIYHKFGKCKRHEKGLCIYKHDPKNISVCKEFLKGNCTNTTCLLSHEVIQEKMATCQFFLEGLCVRDNCPYLHVKLSNKVAICKDFLQGFCRLGKECSKRHLNQCPEFEKYGTCSKGSKCLYPHKKSNKILKTGEQEGEIKSEAKTVKYNTRLGVTQKIKKTKKKLPDEKTSKEFKKKPSRKRRFSIKNDDENSDTKKFFPKRVKLEQLPCYIPLNSDS